MTIAKKDVKAKADPLWTLPVPEAGKKYFGLAPNAAYEAAKAGHIPTIKIGGKLRAVVPAIERMIEQVGKEPDAAA
jgi:hypothetical protein